MTGLSSRLPGRSFSTSWPFSSRKRTAPVSRETSAVVGYRLFRRNARLCFERYLVRPDGGSELVKGSISSLVARGAEDAVEPLRRLAPEGVDWAVSGWDGKCVVRLTGPDLRPVKRAVAATLERLRGRALPRVWQI